MLEDPGLDIGKISTCLNAQHDLHVASVTFLPVGYDLRAAVYKVMSRNGVSYFLKIRFGAVHEPGLEVPRALIERGIPGVLAPLMTRSSGLWCPLNGCGVVLSPFVEGENAAVAGLSDSQWVEFGSTLRAVHDSGLHERYSGRLPAETFALASTALVRRLSSVVDGTRFEGVAATRVAAFWTEHADRIDWSLARAETLGTQLRAKPFGFVLCHADIHAANILVREGGQIYLIDWHGPLIAPRERDLLFVVGSTIARAVAPREEALFFDGYGRVEVDPVALAYYRYERVVEDIGEAGRSVFLDPSLGEETRAAEAELVMRYFEPGGMIETTETVTRHRSPLEAP